MKRQCKLIKVLNIGIACFWFLATLSVVVGLSSNPAEAQPFASVPNYRSDTVSVIDTNPSNTDYNKVISTIEVGRVPSFLAITPDGTRAYVTNRVSGTVSVIDTDPGSTDFNKVVSTIEVGSNPGKIAITPDGTRAYVTRSGYSVFVIDTDPDSADFNKVVSTIQVPIPAGIAITPDGTRAYVTSYGTRSVFVIDTDPSSIDFNKVVSKIGGLGYTPYVVAITPDGSRAYVTNSLDGTVSVIDTDPGSTDFNKVVSTVKVAIRVSGVAITPDGTRAYVTSIIPWRIDPINWRTYVAVIDTETDTVIDTIDTDGFPHHIAITPDGTHAYVTAVFIVQVIEISNNSVVDAIPIVTEGYATGGGGHHPISRKK